MAMVVGIKYISISITNPITPQKTTSASSNFFTPFVLPMNTTTQDKNLGGLELLNNICEIAVFIQYIHTTPNQNRFGDKLSSYPRRTDSEV